MTKPPSNWMELASFHPEDALGAQAPEVIERFLREIGDDGAADAVRSHGGTAQALWRNPSAPYMATGTTYGFLSTEQNDGISRVVAGLMVEGDPTLAGRRIKVTLDHFHAAGYPGIGNGRRKILCEFEGRNQIEGVSEPIHFATTVSVRNGDSAGVSGIPLFRGLTVGRNGIEFMGRTIYLGSTVDDTLVKVFESDVYKRGLSLLGTVQPALAPLALTTGSIVRFLLASSKNEEIHSFKFGLDFEGSSTSPRLRLGSYVVVQGADRHGLSITDYHWSHHWGRLVSDKDADASIPFNYMVFGVSAFEEDDA